MNNNITTRREITNSTITINNGYLFANNSTIKGDDNNIEGNNNTIEGNNNIIQGSENKIIGNKNRIHGKSNKSKGTYNFSSGFKSLSDEFINSHDTNEQLMIKKRKQDNLMTFNSGNINDNNEIVKKSKNISNKLDEKLKNISNKLDEIKDEKFSKKDSFESVCTLCMTNKRKINLLPCNHFRICKSCIIIIFGTPYKNCPYCKSEIEDISS